MNTQEALATIQQLLPRLPMTRAEAFAVNFALNVLAEAVTPQPPAPAQNSPAAPDKASP